LNGGGCGKRSRGRCQYKVKVTDAAEVDVELIGWIRQAYDASG